jgi:plasmid stabilization system protein ParE
MAFKIVWSEEAYKTFTQNLDYLKREWSDKEIDKFTKALNEIIERIKKYPESFPSSPKDTSIRKARINKYIHYFIF